MDDMVPLQDPVWATESATDTSYQGHILHGVKKRVSKHYEIKQEETEEPGRFYERIVTVFCQYTVLNPEAPENDYWNFYWRFLA